MTMTELAALAATWTIPTMVWGPQTFILVAEWIHFTLFGIISPTIRPKVHFLGLMNSATNMVWRPQTFMVVKKRSMLDHQSSMHNTGALITRRGFGGILY